MIESQNCLEVLSSFRLENKLRQRKEKKLRVEDALNATKVAVEEGIVVGGGCTLLRLASKVDAIKDSPKNDEEKLERALSYTLKLIAKNAGANGSVVSEKVLSNDYSKFGYNSTTGEYKDLMAAGIIDPTKTWLNMIFSQLTGKLNDMLISGSHVAWNTQLRWRKHS